MHRALTLVSSPLRVKSRTYLIGPAQRAERGNDRRRPQPHGRVRTVVDPAGFATEWLTASPRSQSHHQTVINDKAPRVYRTSEGSSVSEADRHSENSTCARRTSSERPMPVTYSKREFREDGQRVTGVSTGVRPTHNPRRTRRRSRTSVRTSAGAIAANSARRASQSRFLT